MEKAFIQHTVNKNNSKLLWQSLNKLNINCKQDTSIPPELVDPNELNNFYLDSVVCPEVNETLLTFYKNNKKPGIDEPLCFREVNENQILNIFKNITSNAGGIDHLDLKMWKFVMPYCISQLTHVINFSLLNKSVPQLWKTAKVIPLPKNTLPNGPSDLRPISILPLASKILEKVVHLQVIEHANKYILPSMQSGFRRSHSTNTTLLKIANDMTRAIDNSEVTLLVLLDYSKAFDVINHKLLLAKLRYYCFNEEVVDWFKDYLSGRMQYVELNGLASDLRPINKGVPQGSILGPLLFTIFTSDMQNIISQCTMHQYADDTQLYKSCIPNDINIVISEVNVDLKSIAEWSKSNGLLLNPTKTVGMCVGSNVQRSKALNLINCDIVLNESVIRMECCVKNLGVLFDCHLNFDKHITSLVKNAFFKLKSIYSFKHFLSCDVKWKLSNSIILSPFNYCSSLYFNFAGKYFKNRIQVVQNCCLRYSFNIRYREHVTPFYVHHNILKCDLVFYGQMATLIYNILNTQEPHYLFSLLEQRAAVHNVNLRHHNLLSVPYHKTAKFECCFQYLASKIFNENLSLFTSNLTVGTFKSKLKKFNLLKQSCACTAQFNIRAI